MSEPTSAPPSTNRRLAGLSREQRALLFEQIRKRKESAGAPPAGIPRRPPELDPVPASFAQERLWFMDRLAPGNAVYNIPMALRIGGEVAPAVLEAVLGEVVRRHEALRTTFREAGGQPVQVIAPPSRWSLPLVDLSTLPGDLREAETRRLALEDSGRPFDLEAGPLLHATLLRLEPASSVLLLCMHHIVSDGWSMGVLVREITALYGAAVSARPSPLPELPLQYADFAVWQRGWLRGEVLERQIAYWRERLADVPVSLDLPADRPRPAVPTYRGARLHTTLGRGLKEGLAQLARRHEASLYMVLLAGFQALLGRLSGQKDFSVGSPIANRHRPEVEPLIGFFVNSLVMRGELKGDPSFHELLAQARRSTLEAFAHQDLPFERLVEELQPERHLSVTPLFQTVLALQNAPVDHLDLPGLSLSTMELEATTAESDLELHVWERADSLLTVLAYSTDLFDAPTILRIAGHLETLLRGALADPGRRLSELPLLSGPERAQLLREWNDTRADRGDVPLHRLVEEWAAAQPDAPAVLSAAGEGLTYGELDARAGRLAHRLRDLGVGPESRVAISARRSPELIVGMLAILKAGGAYVPIDPGYPAERISLILEDSGAVARLGDGDLADAPGPALARPEEIDPASAAYVIYTSGSTGTPKGVVVSHRSISRYVRSMVEKYRLTPDDRALQFSSLGFDTSVDEIWCPLASGAILVLRSEEAAGSVPGFLDELERLGVTVLSLPTAFWHELAAALGEEGMSLPAKVRLLVIGGEEAQPHHVASWFRAVREQGRQVELLNGYGPTETTITTTFSVLEGWNVGTPVPIGRPREGARMYGVDRGLRLVPIGVWGELLIGGDGVARGYLHRPDLTAERFVPDAWSGEPGARVYRSGDLVRFRPDGELQFGGRMDQQVKIRGFRIEPGEIESALLRHPQVREAVVDLRKGAGEGHRLVAWVVHRPEPAAVSADSDEQVAQWRTFHDESYIRDEAADTTFDIEGWDSSYTGQAIPAVEMREWVERTVERILSLRPRRVVEIGCGTGLLLFRVAPATEHYLGVDFSRFALDGIRRLLARGGLPQAELRQAEADDWREIGRSIAPGEADLVILNSVSQYFPGADYLARVLEGAVRTVAPGGGSVFIGDVRSLPLLEAFATSVERFQSPDLSPEELRRRVLRRVMEEEELVVDPLFFFALARRLPAVRRVSVLLKRGRWHNELTRFRYDVVLQTWETAAMPLSLVDGSGFSLGDVERLLGPRAVAIGGLVDARVTENGTGIDPEDLWELAERRGYDAELSVDSGSPGRFRALLKRRGSTEAFEVFRGAAPDFPDLPWSAFANDPLRSKLAHRLGSELRRALQAEMPDYMVPSAFVVLDALPLTPNGKVNRAALPDPEPPRSAASTPPRTPAEKALAAVWKDVLGIEEAGLEDNFFELGGHSLLATQLVSRVSANLGVDLPLRTVFERPTLGALADVLEITLAVDGGEPSPAEIAPQRLTEAPLSFAQERLWFIDRLQPGTAAYNVPLPLAIHGPLSPAALEAALGEILRRHGALRTTFSMRGAVPVQVVSPPGPWSLPRVDLSALPAPARQEEILRLAAEDARQPFDLERGPLLRSLLLVSGAAENTLLLAMHHIVSDGWSMGLLVKEIVTLYQAALAGGRSPLSELNIQYTDFAVWQRQWLQGEVLEQQTGYWRERLRGAPAVLELPTDHSRPAAQSFRGAKLHFAIGSARAQALRDFALRHEATAFMVLLAAFQALLRRYTGQDDVVVGSPIANRNRAETAPLIGFFVNTLVLRTRIPGDPPFVGLLADVRETALGAYAHQDLPFERLVEETQPERSLAKNPLFQVMLALENTPVEDVVLPEIRLSPVETGLSFARFDLTLTFHEDEDGRLLGEIEYSTDLFERPTMERLAGHYQILLAAALKAPDRSLAELPLLSEAERAQILQEWNDTRRELPDVSLHRLVEARAAAQPDALAVLSATGEGLTYGELDARAARLAHRLRALGVGPESRVAIAAGRSPELVVGMLAVLKAGGAYVPVDPGYPAERISLILEDSGAVALLRDEDLADRPGPALVDGEAVDPASAAYVIYTSGSTGRPKGVVVPHRSITRHVRSKVETYRLTPADRALQFSSLGFDASLDEIWCPLAAGATLVLRSEEAAGSIAHFLEEVERLGITALGLPTAFWHELATALEGGGLSLPSTVRLVVIGGEEAQPRRVASWFRGVDRRMELLNSYGPTETTISATFSTLREGNGETPVPIGRPKDGARVYGVDRGFRLVPVGVWGELLIGGTCVSRGYLGRPDLTAERFVPDPWSGEPGARLYRSGDLVRFRPDGELQFGGRIDQQVKIRGFRIEPGEIEAVLAAHPGVREVAVVARRPPGGGASLLACVVPAEEGTPDVAELRAFLADRLPAHMVPTAFAVLPRLPLTPNGKVDRRALERVRPEGAPDPAFAPPLTPAEESLAAIWQQVLGVEKVGRHDNFFDLGGHSLMATQLVSRVRTAFGVDLPLRSLFEHQTLSELAAVLAPQARETAATVPLRPPNLHPIPASFAQERLWLLDRLQPGTPAYNLPNALRVLGEVSPALLEAVLGEVVRRHEALRTTFQERDGRPVQVIAPPGVWTLPVIDLSDLPREACRAEARRLAGQEAVRPFDLSRGPLLRTSLLRLEADDHGLLLAMHHIVSDGWSMGVLIREMTALYEAALAGKPSPLPDLPIQYADFAVWQRGWLAGGELKRQLSYWRAQLNDLPESLELPADRPRPAFRTHRGDRVLSVLDAGFARELTSFARRQNLTPFIALLADFQALLGRLAGQEDVPVGTPIANRNRSEIEPLIGFFVNTLVLRGDLTADPPYDELLARTRRVTLDAYAHQDLPFEMLVEELRPRRHLSINPLFQVLFALQNTPQERVDLPGLSFAPFDFEASAAQFDLELNVWEAAGSLALAWTYSTELFDGPTIQRMAGYLETLLRGAMAHPGRRLSDLPLLAEGERHQLLVEWNPGMAAEGRRCLHRRFEEQVDRTPDAIAVSADGESFTYRELDEWGNRLARRLRARGAGPGRRVALRLDRSAGLVAAILAVLKTGAAYVPLDPAYPAERLAFALEDSGAALVVEEGDLSVEGERADRLELPVDPDLPAYVIYTSGSTGRPKGVVVTHANVDRLFTATAPWFGFGPDDIWTLFHSYAFDFSVWELWGALLHGGRLVVVPFWESRDPEAFYRRLRDERVTVLNQTPSAFRQLLRAEEAVLDGAAPDLALRWVIFGGEALEPASLAPWFARQGDETPRLVNMYGITETTVHVTFRLLKADDLGRGSVLGQPIPDLAVHVLDRDLKPQPIGVPGEIHVGGAGLAQGYLARPDLTAERFVPDPFSVEPGARLYRSGDLARRLPDGDLEYLGRIDHQVKIRGFRIELGEIESVLAAHPGVRDVAVVARRTPGGDASLLACVVLVETDVADLRAFLADRLPAHMVPSAFAVLPRLPLTPNGKVDRRALEQVQPEGPPDTAFAPPRTPVEEELAGIWRQLLGVEKVGRLDNFFELGGHSLLATQLVSRVRASLGADLPLRTLFERPTLEGLAAVVEEQRGAEVSESPRERVARLSPEERARVADQLRRCRAGALKRIPHRAPASGPVPASLAQERLWFMDRLAPGNSVFNMPSPLRLCGPLEPEILERSFQEVFRRHESLRTRFEEQDGAPVQVVVPPGPWFLPRVDLRALPADAGRREAERLAAEEGGWPFDLSRGPLLRAVLLRLAEEDHALLMTCHHIVSDGWSIGVLVRELTACYQAFATGRPSPLPELPIQYADYAAWQRARLAGGGLEEQIGYWREQLAGAPAHLDLPLDRPRPAVQTYQGDSVTLSLSSDLSGRLQALSIAESASLFMTLLTGLKVVLHRWSGQDDVVVGTPVAGRERPETEGLIGYFLNLLALRTGLSGNPSFRELLRRVRETALGAYSHQAVPFERLLSELEVERDLSRSPVFQVLFNMLNLPETGATLPGGLAVEPFGSLEAEAKYDFTLYAQEGPGGIHFNLVYNPGLFDPGRMEELLRQLRTVLEQSAVAPDRPLESLSLVTPEAMAWLPDSSRPLAPEWPGAIHERFLAHARRHPDRTVAVDSSGVWTWGDLDAASGNLAASVHPGETVAVWALRAAPLAAALLGVLRAGAAFVVLDPAYPPARLTAVVKRARPQAWIEVPGALPVPPEVETALAGAPRLRVEGPGVPADPNAPCTPVHPDAPAWIAFTSGSTGEPKGIVGSHRPLSHFLDWHARTFGLGEEDRFSLLSGLAHDPLLRDIFTPLWVGGSLRVPDSERLAEPGWLAGWLRREEVTVAHLTPALGRLLEDGCAVPSLRLVCSGGEALTGEDVARLRRVAPGAVLVNFYGATETPQAMGWKVVEGTPARVPLGRGIEGVDLLVLGPSRELAGTSELGEICIRTPYLALGYLGDPAGTAERFAPSPGGRLYRTGDLGRYEPGGDVTYAGRADRQLKIRGFRVEPGEIEAVISGMEGVRDSVVVADGESNLVAYVVPEPGASGLAGRLRPFLASRLPGYMVPAAFVELPALPLTPNGKVDRRALPAPLLDPVAGEGPRTPLEETLAGIWAALLRRPRIGLHESFFDLGGHSLLATQMVARVRAVLGIELPLRVLFDHPTLAGLASRIEAAWRTRATGLPEPPPLHPVPRDQPLPLSFAQERLWFLAQIAPESAAYGMPAAVRLLGDLDREALAATLSEIRRRHETLRTTFRLTGGEPVQAVHPPEPLPLPLADLSALPAEVREAEAYRLAEELARTPYDLARGPLVRARLLRLAADEHALLWNTHHIVSDAWSVGVLVRELAALYTAFAQGRPSPLPELPLKYGDYAAWQRDWLRGPALEEQIGYWRERLAGASPLDLPADRPRPAVPSTRGASRSWTLPAETAEALRRLALAEGATLFMALHAGFSALLHLYMGRTDVAVGSPIANRPRAELEALIGFFINTLVLRSDLAGDPGFRELIARSRETALGAWAHQDLPFEKLVDELGLPRDPFRQPLLRVVLQLRNIPLDDGGVELPGLTLAPFDLEVETAKFDLVLNFAEGADALHGEIRYDTDLFDPATVVRLAGHFTALLDRWIEEPERRLSDLSLLSEGERHQLLVEWNPGMAGEGRRCLHRLFEEQVDRNPAAVAVSAGDERLTYRELDEWANRLSRRLLSQGAGPGRRVALKLDRSAGLVAAILAVLKTGAAYVPLDPAYPAERLAFVLEDSGAALVVKEGDLSVEGESADRLELPADPDLPAYVIYTSGSTGRPKGVVVTHANVDRLLTATEPWFGFGPDDVWTLFHSYAFDFSVWELWGALLYGGRLVVVPYWESRDPEAFYRRLRDERVTVLNQTPSAFRQLLWAEEAVLGDAFPDLALRWVIFGGEALEPASLAPWFARHGDEQPRLVNMYGITETTVHVTFRPMRVDDLRGGSVLGQPIPDLAVHVLDRTLRPQPIGVPGEIHIGGAGLAQGYLGRPDLTAERFVPDPFSDEPGMRLYKSGDLARRLPDGDLEYLGRIDHQVKIRGFRIELGEIEAALAVQPGVREAVVLAHADDHGERRLVAYVVGEAADPAALREALALRLPDHMLPSAFVFLDALPLTENGKVDRRALPAPEAAAQRRQHEPPRTDLERFLAGQFRDVLGLSADREVGRHDDFFELGGTSITGAIFIHRLQEALGEIVHVVTIFDHPTVASLADYVREQHGGKGGAPGTVGWAEVQEMDRLIAAGRPEPLVHPGEPLNPPALFVLAPPRSGTTLLRVMLGVHPRLFAPPELELLSFQTLAERRAAFQGRDSFWLEGLIRAVMEAREVDAAEAARIVEERERQGWTTRRFYGELQQWLGGRMLVDKTPSYALDPEVLRRAGEGFAEARYLHLVRHPQAANRSFEEAKLDQIFFRRPHPFSRRQLAELIWTVSHRNILGFLDGIPRERRLTVRFEELVCEPERVLAGICDFLGLPYQPEMAEPYREGAARMVNGPHEASRMLGDVKFLGHGRVDPAAAERWRKAGEPPLGEPARQVARDLGYLDALPGRSALVPLQTGSPDRRPLFCVHPVGGEVIAYRELARRLGSGQPVYGLQSPDPPIQDLREMAAHYLEALRKVQPGGPYRLAGWSMGGIVAYEIACQLAERGERIELLALIDTASPQRWAGEPEPGETEMVALFASDLARLHGLGIPDVDLCGLDGDGALALVLDVGRETGLLPPGVEPAELRRLFNRFRANRRALSSYAPLPYGGEVTLFLAERVAQRSGEDRTLGWSSLVTGNLELFNLPGDHYTILREEVETLAGPLRTLLKITPDISHCASV